MFVSTYKSTCKILIRSITVWLSLSVLVIVAVQGALNGFHAIYNPELKELIHDTDARYVLEYKVYIQWINNSAGMLLQYIIPIFAIISTALVLNHDYRDGFFEIEKAANIKSISYICGRIIALTSVIFLLSTIVNFIGFHLYVFTRGGVNEMELNDYLIDSTIRLIRINLFRILPCVSFYVCVSYFIGTLFKNGIASSVICMGYSLFCYIKVLFSVQDNGIFLEYFSHDPVKLGNYFHYYDTEWFEETIHILNTTKYDVILCISYFVIVSLLTLTASCFLIHRREI